MYQKGRTSLHDHVGREKKFYKKDLDILIINIQQSDTRALLWLVKDDICEYSLVLFGAQLFIS